MADEITLDHVAVATGTPDDAVSTLVGDLGGTLIEGGDALEIGRAHV